MNLPDPVKQALTEADNQTFDPVRVGAFMALAALVIYQGFTLSTFNAVTFGGGVAAILGAVVAQDRFNTNAKPA